MQRASYVADCLQNASCERVYADNDLEAFAALIWQRADCAITEEKVGAYLSKQFFSGKIVHCFSTGHTLDVVFLFLKANQELARTFDTCLQAADTRVWLERLLAKPVN